jgi:hypothetical protein
MKWSEQETAHYAAVPHACQTCVKFQRVEKPGVMDLASADPGLSIEIPRRGVVPPSQLER